jgi:far upstream element-binding protein
MNKVGLVIGRGGETIRDFEERSKAKILIASDTTGGERDNERVINLVGDDAAVQYAKTLIEDIVSGNNNVSQIKTRC